MALEPITRKEKIIAGENLEPITRLEKFLKEYGGSGGGVSPEEVAAIVKEQFPQIKEQFVVNFSSEDMQNWTCDKTLAEITEAINSGKEVVGSLMIFTGFNLTSVKILLVILFLWFASPVSSHLIARFEVTTNEKLKDFCEVEEEELKEGE